MQKLLEPVLAPFFYFLSANSISGLWFIVLIAIIVNILEKYILKKDKMSRGGKIIIWISLVSAVVSQIFIIFAK